MIAIVIDGSDSLRLCVGWSCFAVAFAWVVFVVAMVAVAVYSFV